MAPDPYFDVAHVYVYIISHSYSYGFCNKKDRVRNIIACASIEILDFKTVVILIRNEKFDTFKCKYVLTYKLNNRKEKTSPIE